MVGCAPASYTFWSVYVVESAIYSRISAAISLLSVPRSNHTQYTQEAYSHSGASGNQIHTDGQSNDFIHPYNVLDDSILATKSRAVAVVDDAEQIPLRDVRSGK
ncbi:hypothetical protein F5B20DRAFT_557180 [Whalleya microplaca]|nr:hypothetical protein F5B20DRAFT_557180 [Whalleya microplaca]